MGRDEGINPPPVRSELIGIQYLHFRLSGIRKPVRSTDASTTVSFDFLKRCERQHKPFHTLPGKCHSYLRVAASTRGADHDTLAEVIVPHPVTCRKLVFRSIGGARRRNRDLSPGPNRVWHAIGHSGMPPNIARRYQRLWDFGQEP